MYQRLKTSGKYLISNIVEKGVAFVLTIVIRRLVTSHSVTESALASDTMNKDVFTSENARAPHTVTFTF